MICHTASEAEATLSNIEAVHRLSVGFFIVSSTFNEAVLKKAAHRTLLIQLKKIRIE